MKTSFKKTGTIFILSLAAFFMLSTSKSISTKNMERAYGVGFITVCHGGHNLKLTAADVNGHLRHGDRLGGCLADTHWVKHTGVSLSLFFTGLCSSVIKKWH